MSRDISLYLPDDLFAVLKKRAEALGSSPAALAAAIIEQELGKEVGVKGSLTADERESAKRRFESHFGKGGRGDPDELDNERIDADLASAYEDNHEEE